MRLRILAYAAALTGLAALGSATATPVAARGQPLTAGQLTVVQAVPGEAYAVSIDGQDVRRDVAVDSLLGPFPLSPGQHRVQFTDGQGDVQVASTVKVSSGSSSDVVLHRPAQVNGSPVVNLYRTPQTPIAPGKARVLVAHTATVAPADVRVDGQVVFTDIANGEYATADVAAGTHSVALLPTGLTSHPILGPLPLTLKPGTVTMVYAVGRPGNGSMNVILHTTALTSNGVTAPAAIDTGISGRAGRIPVTPFHVATR
jgi:hypothetical protein